MNDGFDFITDPDIGYRPVYTGGKCPICREKFMEGEEIIDVDDSNRHRFHADCFDDLLPAELLKYIGIPSERGLAR